MPQTNKAKVMEESADGGSRRVVRVEDLATTVRLKKVQAAAEAEARKHEAHAKALEAKLELKRMALSMSARESASRHLAHFAGLYMFLCVLAFLYAVQSLDGELVAVVAGLVTLVVTTVGGLLRSIVTESKEDPSSPPKPRPK